MTKQSSTSSSATEQVVKTACQLCYCHCGMNVYVKQGRIAKVDGMTEHPVNRGLLCFKGRQAKDYVYSKERLKYPMRRENQEWKRTSWDEALDTIANKLTEIKQEYGATAFASCVGESVEARVCTGAWLVTRFMDALGSPNAFNSGFCYRSRVQAQNLTFGIGSLHCANTEKAKCIVLWGHDPYKSSPPVAQRVTTARRKGAKLIVIDPRRTAPAKEADIHVQPRPGTDGALILGILNTVILEGLFDRDFVEKWTLGFDKLSERVESYPPEKVEGITGVPAERIREIARMYATTRPACILQGFGTLDQVASGFQNSRGMSILQAITGNVDVPGGLRQIALPPINLFRLPEKWGEMMKPPKADEYPLMSGDWGVFAGISVAPTPWVETILSEKPYPIKMMIFDSANPMVTFPNTNKVKKALEKLDFVVVSDIVMTPTAEMADIVLPGTTFLERTDLAHNDYLVLLDTPYMIVGKQAIEELGESRPTWKFWIELARRLGYEEYFPWQSAEELIDYYLEPSGITVKQLKESPSGFPCGTIKYADYFEEHPEELRFPTPSGKVELYCETLEKMGYDPLPSYAEPAESPMSDPELARDYPLILTTGIRLTEYKNSGLRNMPKSRKRMPEALAEIHPESAAKSGISDGEVMIVETKRGATEIKAKVTEDIIPGVVGIPFGWVQGNANVLTDDAPACPGSGYASLKSMLCRVRRKT